MSNKSLIAICLCGLTWTGTAQAGFLGNNLELSFLSSLLGGPSTVSVTPTTPGTVVTSPIPNDGTTVTIGDSTLGINVPVSAGTEQLTVKDLTSPIVGSVSSSGGDLTSGSDPIQISNLPAGTTIVTVPEPGAFNLVALGLMILGAMLLLRRRAAA
jgi:hypothetical protein